MGNLQGDFAPVDLDVVSRHLAKPRFTPGQAPIAIVGRGLLTVATIHESGASCLCTCLGDHSSNLCCDERKLFATFAFEGARRLEKPLYEARIEPAALEVDI